MEALNLKEFWYEEADFQKGSFKLTKDRAPLVKMILGGLVATAVRYKGRMIGNTTLLLGTTFLNHSPMLKTATDKIEKAKSTDIIKGIRLTAWVLGLLTGTKSAEAFGLYIVLLRGALKDAAGVTPKKVSNFLKSMELKDEPSEESGTELGSLGEENQATNGQHQ